MTSRTLRVAVFGETSDADRFTEHLRQATAKAMADQNIAAPNPRFETLEGEPDRTVAAKHHLVVAVGPSDSVWTDISITGKHEADVLATERLVPWSTKWNLGRRAPRAQVAVQCSPKPSWPLEAARLIARLEAATAALPVFRIDHIGSTSVPGLTAKDLVDIQITVNDGGLAVPVAEAATDAGFVHVKGDWFGLDRSGQQHLEQVVVDSDPGRPVNVNIRSRVAPVAREALLFRDWLRAVESGRDRYAAMKAGISGQQVDVYSDNKEPFISAALGEAELWAADSGWRF